MECTDCRIEVERLLCEVPSKWRDQLVNLVCDHIANMNQCPKVMECLNNESVILDFNCLVEDQSEWENLTFIQKLQVIIDKVCSIVDIASIHVEDTFTIDLEGDGSLATPITASLIRDTVTGGGDNILVTGPNGVYVPPPPAIEPPEFTLCLKDTSTTSYSGNGDTICLGFEVKLDPDPTNIIEATDFGLLAQDVEIRDLNDGLVQHMIFEVPPLRDATYDVDLPPVTPMDAFRVVLAKGSSYATNYTASNPDVKVFWDDDATIENSLTNAGLSPNQTLEHTYPGISDFYRTGYVKGYNSSYLLRLGNDNATVISGFKFVKGGQYLLDIALGGYAQGYTGVFDFKGLFNLSNFSYGTGGLTTYKSNYPLQHYDNMEDLLSLETWVSYGNVAKDQDFIFSSPTFTYCFLNFTRNLRLLSMKGKTALQSSMNASAVDTVDMQDSTISYIGWGNCGAYFGGYINKMIFKLNQPLGTGYGTNIWVQGSGIFDFTGTANLTIQQINGVHPESINTVVPSKILFPDFITDGLLRYIDANQDFIKDEAVHSLNNNGLINAAMILVGNKEVHSFGENYLWNYYNPTYDPLNGTSTRFAFGYDGLGGVNTFNIGGIGDGLDNGGHRYNSIPVFTKVAGPGSGFTYEVVMQLGSSNSVTGGIVSGGTGYTIGDILTLGTLGANVLQLPTIKVTSVTAGVIDGFESWTSLGEFKNVLPATLSHTSGGTGTGFILDTTHRWNVRRGIILTAGSGYTSSSVWKNEVSTFNGTGTGTASIAAKVGIDALHNKGWNLRW